MDDDVAVQSVAERMLRYLGYRVEIAGDGEQAIARYQEAFQAGDPFDLVIMDLTIPGGMEGKEAIGRLRQINAGVRAIVSSGYSDDPVMADYRAYGFAGVVAKPYQMDELAKAVAEAMQ